MSALKEPQTYPLAREYVSTARLNLQHFLGSMARHGELIKGEIQADLDSRHQKRLRFADVGTGSAIWLLDLSERVSSEVELYGLDVDLSQCTRREWLPANVSLHHFDAFDDNLLPQFKQAFDLIHVRGFLCVVRNANPAPLVQKLYTMLKPGGWLQWTELDLTTVKSIVAVDGIEHSAIDDVCAFMLSPSPAWPLSSQLWIRDLASICRDNGLVRVAEERIKPSCWMASLFYDNVLLAMGELSLGLPEPARSAVRDKLERAARELGQSAHGVGLYVESLVVIAQKKDDSTVL